MKEKSAVQLKKEEFTIKEYVKNGGIFVSVSGCPFWYAWNKISLGTPSTAGEVYNFAGNTSVYFCWRYDLR